MNSLRTTCVFRTALIFTILLGWLTFSQRCALGQIMTARQAAALQHKCCHEKAAPLSDPSPGLPGGKSGTPDCCKMLTVLVPEAVAAPENAFSDSFSLLWDCVLFVMRSGQVNEPVGTEANAPPYLLTFSELVLHRSLHAHAPPSSI